MKIRTEMDPSAAFPDLKHQPDEAELKTALGAAAAPLECALTPFCATQPAVTTAWQFSPRSGWYQLYLMKKRRLLYLVPQQSNFRLMMLLGGKALQLLKQGPYAEQTDRLLKTAKHYPEGTAFTFDRRTLDPNVLTAFLAAKISY